MAKGGPSRGTRVPRISLRLTVAVFVRSTSYEVPRTKHVVRYVAHTFVAPNGSLARVGIGHGRHGWARESDERRRKVRVGATGDLQRQELRLTFFRVAAYSHCHPR